MSNALSKKVTLFSLMKFTTPTVCMMLFMSFYTMVDGIFVSRYVNTSALSATNIVYPILNIVIALAIMLSTGGSAVIATQMGEGKTDTARESFTLIVFIGLIIGLIILVTGLVFINPIITMMGANEAIFHYCYEYAFILLLFVPLGIMQMLFQSFFVTAGKPQIGLAVIIAGGCTNIILDYVFIVLLKIGIAGAALATGIGFSIPAIFGIFYFFLNKKGTLYFVKLKFRRNVILKSCSNGFSEMITNLSIAVTTVLFNIIMMAYLGEDGVAAITIVLYAEFLMNAVFIGYSSGVAPVISYNYGDKNEMHLKKLFKISLGFISISSIVICTASLLLSSIIVTIFAKPGTDVFNISVNGFNLFAVSFLFTGINIFASSMFTALSNGKVSAIISILRTFVFIVIAIIILPQFLGVNGIWLAVPFAQAMTLFVSVLYFIKLRKVYNY